MDLSHLQALFSEAKRLTGHSRFVVVGSLSILGVVHRLSDVPERMLMSIDIDCYTKEDPERVFDLAAELGEGSPFERTHGYYLDPVTPQLPTLPAEWAHRLIQRELEGRISLYFLDPHDAAVSKYARCDVRDREWLRAGLVAGLLSAPIIESRFRDTDFLDAAERDRAYQALAEDARLVRAT